MEVAEEVGHLDTEIEATRVEILEAQTNRRVTLRRKEINSKQRHESQGDKSGGPEPEQGEGGGGAP
jgi:hypothetical protein